MACSNCVPGKNGTPSGCNSKGGCASGGCNRLNTYDWLSMKNIRDVDPFNIVEVSFKKGARKSFFNNPSHTYAVTGDMVVVESGNGYDVGKLSLSGELVRLQMKKKKVDLKSVSHKIIRRANSRDLDKLGEARALENKVMVKARVIARNLKLEMKLGDVEYQGDKRKATFFYTADGRVDFRELIRQYAKEFKVKIEMRQIGARQESARIGGVGSCGRELCCSTWLTDFKSVSTTAARYQNLAINQAKLSGQCGRLKCCLNYELDTYMDALQHFPKNADKLHTTAGTASLVKTDVFKGLMYYAYDSQNGRGKFYPLKIDRVKEILELNANDEKPDDLVDFNEFLKTDEGDQPISDDYQSEDLTGVIELPMEKRRRRSRNRNRNRNKGNSSNQRQRGKRSSSKSQGRKPKSSDSRNKNSSKPQNKSNNPKSKSSTNSKRRNNRKNRPPRNKGGKK